MRQLAAELGSEQKTGEIGEQVKAGNEMPLEQIRDILLTAHAMYTDSRDARAEGELKDAVVERAHADLRELIRQWVSSHRTTQEVIQSTGMEPSEIESLQRALLESVRQQQADDLEDGSGTAVVDRQGINPKEDSAEFATQSRTIYPQEADVSKEPEHLYRAKDSQAFRLALEEVPRGYPDPPPMEFVVVRYGVVCYSHDNSKDVAQQMQKSVDVLNHEFKGYVQIRHVTDPWTDVNFRVALEDHLRILRAVLNAKG